MRVYAVSLKSAQPTPPLLKDWRTGPRITTCFAVAHNAAGAIALAQAESPDTSVVSCSDLGAEADLAAKPRLKLTINGETFEFDQPGLLASAPAGTKVLRADGGKK